MCLAFFFLLRPGEYTSTTNADATFSLADVRLFMGNCYLDLARAPIPFLNAAASVNLCFTTQKNQVKGKSVSLRAQPVVKILARKMFRHGTYNFLPTAKVDLSPDV